MKFPCPTCGKSRSHPENEAGLTALCTACGTPYIVPEPVPVSAEPVQPGGSRPAPPVHRSDTALLMAATFLVCVAACLVCWAGLDWHRAAEAQVVARAMEMKAHDDLMAASGHPDLAREGLRDLRTFLERQTPSDPEVDRLWEQLPKDEKAMDALVAARATAPPAPPPAPTSEQVAVAQPPAQPAPTPVPAPAPPPASSPEPRPEMPAAPAPSIVPTQPSAPVHTASARPPVQPVTVAAEDLTDEQIGRSITHGVDYLLTKFNHYNQILRKGIKRDDTSMGLDILCVYALMQCQQATGDPRLNPHEETMKGLIDGIKGLPLKGYRFETYARGLRATALGLYNRPEDAAVLREDANVLVQGSYNGGYTYEPRRGPIRSDDSVTPDNSNSQYGLLGVWSAAEAGRDVPDTYWASVQRHWMHAQDTNGQWSYGPDPEGSGTHSMTCAGLASLYVAHDWLDMPRQAVSVGRDPFTPPLAKGLHWLEDADNSIELDHGAYDLYGLERVGLASGFKYFGSHDWYRQLAAQSIRQQQSNGSWGDDVETAYNLLFLARGRHPILMNKLRFEGYWANRPRDLANLSRFMSHELERQLNWQIVPLARPWTDWT
ncbi:MAG TPA: hypothetical protein VLJ39_17860, partial [Tepidisphaeraceae bacterium]|nr:hypothetical protein [Tepidisphaeraceae bacterium]